VEAPWDAFVPTLFARRVPGVKLKPRSITTVQLVSVGPHTRLSLDHARYPTTPSTRRLHLVHTRPHPREQTLSKFEVDTQLNPKFDTGPFRMELQSVEAF
jgi:hypothetical protein